MQRIANPILTIIFAGLCAINFAYLLIGFLSIPRYYERVTTLMIDRIEMPGANFPTNESIQQRASEHRLTLGQFAVEQIVFHSAIVLFFLAVAGVIILRSRWNWFAWYSAFFLIFIAEFAFYDEIYVARLLPLWVYEVGALFWPLILLYFFLFPNGKAAPRKAWWVIAPFVVLHLAVQISSFRALFYADDFTRSFLKFVLGPVQVLIYIVFLFILGCQVYRYKRISTREEKQQTKWFLMGFVFFISLSIVSESLGSLNPYRGEIGLLIFAFVPFSLGVAILRYRLWDIDLLIRRTLQYGLLTAALALVFFGGVALLQQVLSRISGVENSPAAIVLSTLAIAALFNPLRRRIQETIDHRFYRRKYDAEKALSGFAAAARSETDLDELSNHLVEVVRATLQPEISNLWLSSHEHGNLIKPGLEKR